MNLLSAKKLIRLVDDNKKLSETIIPELVCRLIKSSADETDQCYFPFGDSVITRGFDGELVISKSHSSYVPEKQSFWEIGTDRKYKVKAKKDYRESLKKTTLKERKQSTYVQVLTRLIGTTEKKQLINELKVINKDYKKIIIYDANDIELWLKDNFHIILWLLNKYGEPIDEYSVDTVDHAYIEHIEANSLNIGHDLYLYNNNSAIKSIEMFLDGNELNHVSIKSNREGNTYSFRFALCVLHDLFDGKYKDKCLVVYSVDALRYVSTHCNNIVILIRNVERTDFLLNESNKYIFFDTPLSKAIVLNEISKGNLRNIFNNNAEALTVLKEKNYDVGAFMRCIDRNYLKHTPPYFNDPNRYDLVPIMLLGKIDLQNHTSLQLLKSLVGDDYDNYIYKMNVWSNKNDSPIYRKDNTFCAKSRKEFFSYITIDYPLKKIISLSKTIKAILKEVDKRYELNPDQWIMNSPDYQWDIDSVIETIKGFIYLAHTSIQYQYYFDVLTKTVFDGVLNNFELSLTIRSTFLFLFQLSKRSTWNYLNDALLKGRDTLIRLLDTKTTFVADSYVFMGSFLLIVDEFLKLDDYVSPSFEYLLKLYDSTNNERIKEHIKKVLSPVYTHSGLIRLTLQEKGDILYKHIDELNDREKYKDIVTSIASETSTIGYGVVELEYGEEPSQIEVTYEEIFAYKRVANEWLILESSTDEFISLYNKNINSLFYNSEDNIKSFIETVRKKVVTMSDDNKTKIYVITLKKIYELRRFENRRNYRGLLGDFEALLADSEPEDLFARYRFVFEGDHFPLLHPPIFGEDEYSEKEEEMRVTIVNDVVSKVLESYDDAFKKIVSINRNRYVWDSLFARCTDKLNELETILESNNEQGIRYYLYRINPSDLVVVKNKFVRYKPIIFKNLPFNDNSFVVVSDDPFEHVFWENNEHFWMKNIATPFDYIFDKYIKYCPPNLLSFFAFDYDIPYDKGLVLLQELSKNNNIKIVKKNDLIYELQEVVKKMDNKFDTDELALAEFKLIGYLYSYEDKYPLGIRRYFWNHPKSLASLLIDSSNRVKTLPENSIGKSLLFDSYTNMSSGCLIPQEYLLFKKEEIKRWTDGIMFEAGTDINDKQYRLLRNIVLNTLSFGPADSNGIWPIKEIADIVDSLGRVSFDESNAVANHFEIARVNQGTLGFVSGEETNNEKVEEYMRYASYYIKSHPTTYKALVGISNHYKEVADYNKRIRVDD